MTGTRNCGTERGRWVSDTSATSRQCVLHFDENSVLYATTTNYAPKFTRLNKVGLSPFSFLLLNNVPDAAMNFDSLKLTRLLSCGVQSVLSLKRHARYIVGKKKRRTFRV